MPLYTDQLNRVIDVPDIPKRIISLVPSQTELLFDLGLEEEVIGITKFCVHPQEWFRNKTRIGGTKNINIPLVVSLQPDLIIANKEENTKEQIEQLDKVTPVWISDVENISGAFAMMEMIGEITGRKNEAAILISKIKKSFTGLRPPTKILRAAYLIWKDPYMTVGSDTFISNMMETAGIKNVFDDQTRYPEITIEEIRAKNTELVLLSSEPYPFKQKHIDELQNQLCGVKILLVDGEMFSWYGSRMLYAADYLNELVSGQW